MNLDLLKSILTFVVLLLAQVLMFNHIHLFNCATPMIYLFIVLHFRRDYPRWAVLTWCFLMGISMDVFSNTPGVAAAAMTLVGLVQPYLLSAFVSRDSADDLKPTILTLGFAKFFYYTLIIVFLYCIIFFTLETFNFFNLEQWTECILGSTGITMTIIMVIEYIGRK